MFLTIKFLLIFCTIDIKNLFTSKSFGKLKSLTSHFHFYLYISFIFLVQSLLNISLSLYKHFKFCFCLEYTNLHYFHSYWLIRDFCHGLPLFYGIWFCCLIYNSSFINISMRKSVFSFPALIYLSDWRTFTTCFNFLSKFQFN